MKNYTKEQIERINEIFDSIGGEEIQDIESLEDKIEAIWQYYECAGFGIKTEKDLFELLGI